VWCHGVQNKYCGDHEEVVPHGTVAAKDAEIAALKAQLVSTDNMLWDVQDERDRLREALHKIQGAVDVQAEDERLWFLARTAPEAYLQQELRRLHAKIESVLAVKP
jgi:sensor histidine kinase regulating citrate/malate metabolism